MADDTEIKVLLTADMAQLQAGMEQGAATVKTTAEQMQATIAQEAAAFNAAVQTKIDAQVQLNAAFQGGITSTAGIAEAEAALDQAMAAGAVSANEYAAHVATLDAAEAALAGSTVAATAATVENTAAQISSRTAYSASALITDALTGQFGRSRREVAALANETGLLQRSFGLIMSPLGLATIGIAALGVEVFKAGDEFRALDGALTATGGALGYTAGQLDVMASRVGKSTGDLSAADEAFQKLALSGRFAGNDLRLVGTAAAEMAAMTGQSVGSIIAQIEKLQEDPLRAVAKLNDQFHFLTVAEYEQMQQLAAAGDISGAASIAYAAMADNMGVKTEQVHEHVNVLIKAWRDLKNTWNDQMQSANVALGGGDTAEHLAEAQKILKNMQDQNAALLQIHSHSAGLTAEMKLQTDRVTELTAKLHEQSAAAAGVGEAAQKSAAQIDAMAKKHGGGGSRDLEKDLRQQEADQKISYDHRAQFEMEYWGQILQTAKQGSEQYTAAWDKVQQLQKQMDEQQLAAWKKTQEAGTEAARKTAQAARESAQERISMEREVTREMQKAAAQQLEGQQEVEKSTIAAAQGAFAAQKVAIESAFTLKQTTKQQELTQLAAANDAEYALELAAMQKYLALLDTKSKAYAQVNAQIEKLEQAHQQAMQKIQDQAALANQQMWEKRLEPINRAFDQSIQGMIQGTQTFKQGLDRMLSSIVASYIQTGVNMVMHWVATEAAKTTATAVGTEQRQTIEQSAATQSKITDAATGKSQITSAAATGAAKAYQAIVGIPIVGPVLAPIAAGVAFAGIEAFSGMISSAQGGWERVPMDGMMTELHKDEMVLPKHIADPMRQMAQKGGQGGGQAIHVHTTDPRSWKDQLRRDPSALVNAMKYAQRRGHFGR
jgi:hypothetical protein